MATLKSKKSKEDAQRQALEADLEAILASQGAVVGEMHKVFAKIEALSLPEDAPASEKQKKVSERSR